MARRKKASTGDILFFWYGLIAELVILLWAFIDECCGDKK